MNLKKYKIIFTSLGLLALNSCSLPQAVSYNVSHSLGNKAPQYAPSIANSKRKIGRPYSIKNEHGNPIWYTPMNSSQGYREYGIASWYGKDFHAKKTANGEDYNMYSYTAAHKTLPLPTYARVTNTQNGKSIIVRINDRGPFYKKRLIDMSYAGAKALGFDEQGTAPVLVEAISVHGGDVRRSRFRPNQPAVYAKKTTTTPKVSNSNYSSFTTRIANRNKNNNIKTNNQINNTSKTATSAVSGNYFVQLGSFTDINNARKLYYLAKQNMQNVKITSIPINNTTFYRVVIDKIADEYQANKVLNEITSFGFNDAIIAKK